MLDILIKFQYWTANSFNDKTLAYILIEWRVQLTDIALPIFCLFCNAFINSGRIQGMELKPLIYLAENTGHDLEILILDVKVLVNEYRILILGYGILVPRCRSTGPWMCQIWSRNAPEKAHFCEHWKKTQAFGSCTIVYGLCMLFLFG